MKQSTPLSSVSFRLNDCVSWCSRPIAPEGTKTSNTRSASVVSAASSNRPISGCRSQVAIVDEAEDRGDAEQARDRREDFHPFSSPVRGKLRVHGALAEFEQRERRSVDYTPPKPAASSSVATCVPDDRP